jgi:hypothetical protein
VASEGPPEAERQARPSSSVFIEPALRKMAEPGIPQTWRRLPTAPTNASPIARSNGWTSATCAA